MEFTVSVEPDNSSFTVEAFDFVFDEDAAPSPMLVQVNSIIRQTLVILIVIRLEG
jgi:hypothetical protein